MKTCFKIVWAFLCTLFFPIFVSDSSLGFSNSYFSVLMCIGLFCLLYYADKKKYDRRMHICTHILGLIFASMTAFGYALDNTETIWFSKLAVSILLFSHIFGVLLTLFWDFLIKLEAKADKTISLAKPFQSIIKIISWMMEHPISIYIFLLVCWLPCYIADFPGGFRYDATKEYNQIINGFSGDFPMLHSVLITRILSVAYKLTGSYNAGVAFYTIIQMFLISAMYTHILCKVNKQGGNKILLAVIMLYCGCFPVIQILVTQTVRDIFFSALLTYTIFLFYLMETEKGEFWGSISKPITLGLVLVFTLLARNNNAGAVASAIIVMISILIFLYKRKEDLRGAAIFAGTAIGGYIIFSVVLAALCQPLVSSNTGASLSVMSQSIARAYTMESDKWSEDEIEELSIYMNLDNLQYVADNADYTKSRLTVNGNFRDFFKFWCKIGKKHFGCYLDAIFANTQDMWFPNSVVDGYHEIYGSYDKCYYYIKSYIEEPAVHENLFPNMLYFYTRIGLYISFEKIPVISMLFSIGFQFWLLLNCVFYLIYRKEKRLYLPISIILGYMVISAFVPLVLLRYFAAIFFTMPMIMIFTIQPSVVSSATNNN